MTLNLVDNYILGRCLDVYDESSISISRQNFGLVMRKCYICNDIAHNCIRSKKHSKDEVKRFVKSRFEEYTRKLKGAI